MRILLVKLGAIGDVIQTAIAVRHYRSQHPDDIICWLTSDNLFELVTSMGVADHVMQVQESKLLSGSISSRILYLLKYISKNISKYIEIDTVITAYSDWRYRLLTAAIYWKPHRSFNQSVLRPSPIHHRNRSFEYWRLLSLDDTTPFDIPAQALGIGDRLLAQSLSKQANEKLSILPQRFIVMIPGGARNLLRDDNLRRWPLNNYLQLAEKLIESGTPVVLAGGPDDKWVIEAFSHLPCHNIIGQTSLMELIHVFDRADAIISHDTGPMHLAVLTKTPLVALFGPTPSNAVIPLGRKNTIVLQPGNLISCSPCYDGRNYAVCKNALCMDAISVTSVMLALQNTHVYLHNGSELPP